MKVLVTGSSGFIGKNLCITLNLIKDIEVLHYNKSNSIEDLKKSVQDADFIFHLAGVNRPTEDGEYDEGNNKLTIKIIDLLRKKRGQTPILITSSIQAELDNLYGNSKRAAENAIFAWHRESGSAVYVYRLPGIFGKWCRPNYNSVVATFCNNIANKLPIEVSDSSRIIKLAYIDDVVECFTHHLKSSESTNYLDFREVSRTFDISLGELKDRINTIRDIRSSLVIPNLDDELNKFLYATYVSYLKKDDFGYKITKHTDQRGWLAEFVKSRFFGQIFISKTAPGITRGNHWHNTKIEKFLVVAGKAQITFRNKINDQEIISYTVSGDDMKVLDIPTGYVHAIKNVGDEDLITIFWANEILDKEKPDTYYENVREDG